MDSDGPTTVALTVNAPAWEDGLGAGQPLPSVHALAERIVRAALDTAAPTPWLRAGEVSLLLTDDNEIRTLNATYRNQDRSTNVLSFPGLDLVDGRTTAVDPLPGPAMLGDVVMSCDRLLAEAGELGKAPLDHFAHLLVHGTLHLLGYDHEDDARAEVMEALEAKILKMLGFAAPYAPMAEVDAGHAAFCAAS